MSLLLPVQPRTAGTAANLARRVKRWLLAGLILVAPAYITARALLWVCVSLDRPLRNALQELTGHDIPGVGIVTTLLLLLVAGAIGSSFVLSGLIRWFEGLLDRIPLVRTLYSGVKQLIAPLGDEGGNAFQKVVMIRYPDHETYALGFLIRPHAGTSPSGEPLAAVLVPTNHLHLGNIALVPTARIHDVDLTAEQGLRFLVSMGAALDTPIVIRPPAYPTAK